MTLPHPPVPSSDREPLLAGSGIKATEPFAGQGFASNQVPRTMHQSPVADDGLEVVTCPDCGAMTPIDSAQRRAEDFCPQCDSPLFWARSVIVHDTGEQSGASLRRLPGTVGRAATAGVPCPHCTEPNSPTAVLCIRCGGEMNPAPVAAPVIMAPEPEPAPIPEPEPTTRWWWWVAAIVTVLAVAAIVWVLSTR